MAVPSTPVRPPFHRLHQPALRRPLAAALLAGLLPVSPLPGRDLPAGPDVIFGELFADVQRAHCFPDQKTFVDAVPKQPVDSLLAAYAQSRQASGSFDPCRFAREHFLIPESQDLNVPPSEDITAHIRQLWPRLTRSPDRAVPGSSLLPLPHPYIVPGGRFREVYYWDSYFTMLGLRVSGETALIESMIENFAAQLRTYGLIPNGNRTYYLTRSQPPFFALMVELLADLQGPQVYRRFLPALLAEHAYWNDTTVATQHRVTLPDGSTLTRYYDMGTTPRPEAFAHDEEVAHRTDRPAGDVYRDLRSACESGWDFSSRWLADSHDLARIRTTDIVPVDLNCLLLQLERTLARAHREAGDEEGSHRFAAAARERQAAILRHCWSERTGFFHDYHPPTDARISSLTLAGIFPLFIGIASPDQATAVRRVIEEQFLRPGGVVTTPVASGQQWDAPNGWAPLQWVTIHGLQNYGHHDLAEEIAQRWIELNEAVYQRTGKLMEKYNVEDTSLEAGGGEYPGQDGFGWTNGVLLHLLHMTAGAGSEVRRSRP